MHTHSKKLKDKLRQHLLLLLLLLLFFIPRRLLYFSPSPPFVFFIITYFFFAELRILQLHVCPCVRGFLSGCWACMGTFPRTTKVRRRGRGAGHIGGIPERSPDILHSSFKLNDDVDCDSEAFVLRQSSRCKICGY